MVAGVEFALQHLPCQCGTPSTDGTPQINVVHSAECPVEKLVTIINDYGDARDPVHSAEQRKDAHAALDRWFDEVARTQPDYGMGEQAELRFVAGYNDGFMGLTCRRSMEKEL